MEQFAAVQKDEIDLDMERYLSTIIWGKNHVVKPHFKIFHILKYIAFWMCIKKCCGSIPMALVVILGGQNYKGLCFVNGSVFTVAMCEFYIQEKMS